MNKFKYLVSLLVLLTVTVTVSIAQTPQTNDIGPTQPPFSTNAKWVNGVAIGYWPTCTNQGATASCSGLTLYIGPGMVMGDNGKTLYGGGSLAVVDNLTNQYIRINPSSGAPYVNTSPFTGSDAGLTIADITTAGGVITRIADDRTIFSPRNNFNLGFVPSQLGGNEVDFSSGYAACLLTNDQINLGPSSFPGITVDTWFSYNPNTCNIESSASSYGVPNKIPLAKASTTAGIITLLEDVRTAFNDLSGGGGGGPTLQTNGAPNAIQTLLNLLNGTGIAITADGAGGVTIGVTGAQVSGTALIDQFPTSAMKGSFVGAQYYNGTNVTGTIPMWFYGPTPGSCGARSYFPVPGWLRNTTLTTTTVQGDGQLEIVKPVANCIFNGMGGSGLTIFPGTAIGGTRTLNGLYRVEQLNPVDFALDTGGTAGSQVIGAANQYAVPGMLGMEFISDSQAQGGAMFDILGGFGTLTPIANTTYYSGPGLTRLSTIESDFPLVLPVAGTLQYFSGSMTTNNGNAATTVTVRKNLAASALTFTVAAYNIAAPDGQAGAHADLTHTVSMVAGDTVDWEIAQAAGANGGNFANFMLGFSPTNGTSALLYGTFANKAHGGTNYFGPFSNQDSSTEIQEAYTLPRGGIASKLYLYIGTAIGGGQSDVFTIRRAPAGSSTFADTALTCTISSTDVGVVSCDLAHTVTFTAGDLIVLKQALTAGNYPPGTWSLAYD